MSLDVDNGTTIPIDLLVNGQNVRQLNPSVHVTRTSAHLPALP